MDRILVDPRGVDHILEEEPARIRQEVEHILWEELRNQVDQEEELRNRADQEGEARRSLDIPPGGRNFAEGAVWDNLRLKKKKKSKVKKEASRGVLPG